ncbi:MAG: hypothetical protein ACI4RC_00430 [Oscillospiraceae bacterium]
MKKIIVCVVSALACMSIFASCGGRNKDNNSVADKATTTTTTVTTTTGTSAVESKPEASSHNESSSVNDNSDTIADDVRRGVDKGIDTTESIVNDILG